MAEAKKLVVINDRTFQITVSGRHVVRLEELVDLQLMILEVPLSLMGKENTPDAAFRAGERRIRQIVVAREGPIAGTD